MTSSTEEELAAFIARHRELLLKERAAEIERSGLLLSNCSQKQLEHKGLALGALGVSAVNIGLGGKTLVELERPAAYHTSPIFPPHTLRPGDLARIEENVSSSTTKKPSKAKKPPGDDKQTSAVEGVVYKVSDTRIVIASDSETVDLPERCRAVKLANSTTYDRMDKALDHLEKMVLSQSATGSGLSASKLVQVLLGISGRSPKSNLADVTFFDDSLNDSQKDAIRFVLQSPEVACIHGPPGTGKTHTLIEIIRQLTAVTPTNPKPLRLLVCGASNLSVDNILERLLALPPPAGDKAARIRVTRVGHPARVMAHEGVLDATLEVKAGRTDQAALAKDVKNELEATLDLLSGKGKGAKGKGPRGAERKKMWDDVRALRKEYRKREGGVVESVLSESQVVLATCHTAGGRQLYKQDFDVLIIDEATQAMEAVCWIPIFKAKKLILAGDPMQLPPTVLSLDEGKRKKKLADKTKNKPAPTKKTTPAPEKTTPKAAPPEADNPEGSSSEKESGSEDGGMDDADADDEDKSVLEGPAVSKPKKTTKRGQLQRLCPPKTLETTLFDRLERMYGPSIKKMLKVQYRMHATIGAFPSKTLYASKLVPHASVAARLLRDLPNVSAEEDEADVLEMPVVFFDTAGCEYYERVDGDGDEGSKCNENEATVVKQWVEKLVGAGVLPAQIAIITPYQAQVQLLTTLLRPVYGPEIEIGSVDGMQGREKDAVIISLVRSNSLREVGFLKEKRRLNVAMTRAKRHLCVVGDSSTVQHGSSFLKRWMAWLEENADVRFAEV